MINPPSVLLRTGTMMAGIELLSGAIHIVVESGRVDLEGEVATEAERRRVVELARAVHGVSAISNHLTVSQPME